MFNLSTFAWSLNNVFRLGLTEPIPETVPVACVYDPTGYTDVLWVFPYEKAHMVKSLDDHLGLWRVFKAETIVRFLHVSTNDALVWGERSPEGVWEVQTLNVEMKTAWRLREAGYTGKINESDKKFTPDIVTAYVKCLHHWLNNCRAPMPKSFEVDYSQTDEDGYTEVYVYSV